MVYIGVTLQPLEGAQGSLYSTASTQGLRMGQVEIILLDLGLQEWLFSLDPLVYSLTHMPSSLGASRTREDGLSLGKK